MNTKKAPICGKDPRRDEVRAKPGFNGLDYLEVSEDQLKLTVYFLGKAPEDLTEANFRIEGGLRIGNIKVTGVKTVRNEDPELDDVVVLALDKYGDFSTYTLRLVGVKNIDQRYDHIEFSFKVDCASDLDCAPVCACQTPAPSEPAINYLAKDFASFRQLILDRLALLMPDWNERHAPDLGVALIEMLAYVGDYLSYYQDAVATESYLDTARERISVGRHTRLVDYYLHEGCNARAWVYVQVSNDVRLNIADTAFIAVKDDFGISQKTVLSWDDVGKLPPQSYEIFEPLYRGASLYFRAAHGEIRFYTWGGKECCLPRGTTAATLLDAFEKTHGPISVVETKEGPGEPGLPEAGPRSLHLIPGDVLIFEEVIGPKTGLRADADPAHRHAVRLTKVNQTTDPLDNMPLVEIEWAEEDALPFPLCLSTIGQAPDCKYLENVSVARGNVVLVDHGRTIDPPEDLGSVTPLATDAKCVCADRPGDIQTIPARYSPKLAGTPLTYSEPARSDAPATDLLMRRDPRKALPQTKLRSGRNIGPRLIETVWTARRDLLESNNYDAHFVVEIDNDGVAHLRFGDGDMGMQPQAGTSFTAEYRVGNGSRGSVGAGAISRIILRNVTLSGMSITVRNPMPAQGGIDAEPISEAKLFAPHSFRKQIERAIIAGDYEKIAERNPKIQKASAGLVWTGSWYEADVAIDPFGTEDAEGKLFREIRKYLDRYRRMGHDLAVERARYVPIDLEMKVCVLPHFQRAHVKAALLHAFSNRILPDGKLGFFHPDNLTFGEGLFLSKIISAAQAVPGVESVCVNTFERLDEGPNKELGNGVLPLSRHEMARLDNDPNYPERGKLIIEVGGGR